MPATDIDHDTAPEVLELTETVSPPPAESAAPAFQPATAKKGEAAPAPLSSTLISDDATNASRQALAALSTLLVKPVEGADNTLEGLVREMLRPMLKAWLDQKLPEIVEDVVSREVARISGRGV